MQFLHLFTSKESVIFLCKMKLMKVTMLTLNLQTTEVFNQISDSPGEP